MEEPKRKIKFLEPLECAHKRLTNRPVGPKNEYGMVPTEIYCLDCEEIIVPWQVTAPVPAVIPTFDIAGAKEKIFLYQEEVNKMHERAEALLVDSDATNKEATELGTTAMVLYQKIRAIKSAIPFYVEAKTFVEDVNNFEKMLTEKLQDPQGKKRTIVSIMKQKLSQYTAKLESERRIQEALIEKGRQDLQNKLNEEAKKTGTIAPKVPATILPKKEATVRTESGSSYAVHKWIHEIIDLKLIPVKYLLRAVDPIESKQGAAALKSVIQDEVGNGVRDPGIPGVHIYEDITTSFRK